MLYFRSVSEMYSKHLQTTNSSVEESTDLETFDSVVSVKFDPPV